MSLMSSSEQSEFIPSEANTDSSLVQRKNDLTRLRQVIETGWEQARAGNLLTPEEVWSHLEEHKRQWFAHHADKGPATTS